MSINYTDTLRTNFEKHKVTNHSRALPSSDNIYVDLKVSNSTEERSISAQYEQTRTEQILANPSNYYLSLVRWKVPAFDLPILIFPIDESQNDENLSLYSVTLETSTDISQVFLYYTSYNVGNAGPVSNEYYFVYTYQHMLDMINQALLLAFETVTGKPAGSSTAPYMIYEPDKKLFSIIAETPYFNVDINPTPIPPANPTTQPSFDAGIKIYFNYRLFSLFNGLPARIIAQNSPEVTQGRDAQILIANYNNNTLPNGFLTITQNFSSVAYWRAVKQILFNTKLLPINAEYTSTSTNAIQKILTDFEPIETSSSDIETTLQFFPQGPYRLTDLVGTNPIYKVDLEVKWLDINGNEYSVLIPPFQQFSAKLLFVKRNLYKSDNLIYEH